jgi:uncharacterized protein YkwD
MLIAIPEAAALELIDVANLVRSRHCGDESVTDKLLRASVELDVAASSMAEGKDLEVAAVAAGYRARSSAALKIRAPQGRNDTIAKTLADRFCHVVANPAFVDLGVYRRGEEAWLVFADGAPLPDPDDAGLIARLLARVNALRSEPQDCGSRRFAATQPLQRAAPLEEAARRHAMDMAATGFLDHSGSDGSGPSDRATGAGYAWKRIAENIAAGQTKAETVFATWLASPGHCANMMDPRATETGIAYAVSESDSRAIFWVQIYALPD